MPSYDDVFIMNMFKQFLLKFDTLVDAKVRFSFTMQFITK